MSNLSTAAIALEADLCLLTRLPLPKEADLNDIKERIFGSVEGAPRTETQSKRRYVDAIIGAFNASGATSIDDFAHKVHRLHHDVVDAERRYEVAIQLRNDAQKLSAAFEKENVAFRKAQEDRLKEQGEAPMNADHRDFIPARRRANDLEAEVNHLRAENANLGSSVRALTTERDRLAARVREHEETLTVLSNVNAELFKTQQELREARDESKRWHDCSVSTHAKWEKTEQERDGLREENERLHANNESFEERLQNLRDHVRELQAETVEQESRYNHLALVVVDLLKGRGVE
jgi:chromosome segregation ATPase